MTRETDEFLRLDDRVRIARQHEADLLISIHADTISLKGIRGATVYTVSDKASDAEAQALADRENLSDQFAGIEIKDDNKEVTDILIDLIRRETHNFSMSFAHTLVGQLSTSVGAHQQSAAFGRLQGAEGARRSVGAGRTRLSLQRQGRGAIARCRLARQGGPEHHQRGRAVCFGQARRSQSRQRLAGAARHTVAALPATTPARLFPPRQPKSALPYFVHMAATWSFDCGLGPFQNLARKAASFRKFPNHGLERE